MCRSIPGPALSVSTVTDTCMAAGPAGCAMLAPLSVSASAETSSHCLICIVFSRSLCERRHHKAPPEHECIGDMPERRKIGVAAAGLHQFGETAIKTGIFRLRPHLN